MKRKISINDCIYYAFNRGRLNDSDLLSSIPLSHRHLLFEVNRLKKQNEQKEVNWSQLQNAMRKLELKAKVKRLGNGGYDIIWERIAL